MTDNANRAAAMAIADLIDRLAAEAAELPGEVQVERQPDGIVLSGRGLALRLLKDVRLRDLAATAVHR